MQQVNDIIYAACYFFNKNGHKQLREDMFNIENRQTDRRLNLLRQ